MDTSEFDTEIKILQSKIMAIRSQMEPLSQHFIQLGSSSLLDSLKRCVEETVKRYPEVIVSLGPKGVRNIKQEVETFYSQFPSTINNILRQDQFWPHRETWVYSEESGADWWQAKGESLLRNGGTGDAIDKMAHQLFAILKEHEMPYTGTFVLPSDMTKVGIEYAGLLLAYQQTKGKLDQVQHNKLKAEAQNLWDNA